MSVNRTRLAIKYVSGALVLSCATWALAQTSNIREYNKTVLRIGAQGTFFYVAFNESLAKDCEYGNIYVAEDRKGMYVQLLTAKLTGRKISRIDYSQPAGDGTRCNLELVEFVE